MLGLVSSDAAWRETSGARTGPPAPQPPGSAGGPVHHGPDAHGRPAAAGVAAQEGRIRGLAAGAGRVRMMRSVCPVRRAPSAYPIRCARMTCLT